MTEKNCQKSLVTKYSVLTWKMSIIEEWPIVRFSIKLRRHHSVAAWRIVTSRRTCWRHVTHGATPPLIQHTSTKNEQLCLYMYTVITHFKCHYWFKCHYGTLISAVTTIDARLCDCERYKGNGWIIPEIWRHAQCRKLVELFLGGGVGVGMGLRTTWPHALLSQPTPHTLESFSVILSTNWRQALLDTCTCRHSVLLSCCWRHVLL